MREDLPSQRRDQQAVAKLRLRLKSGVAGLGKMLTTL